MPMPKPQNSRRICCYPDYWSFAPDQDTANDTVTMSLDEFETIRLIDYQAKTQEQCAAEMNVARTNVTAIYDNARKKLAEAFVSFPILEHFCCVINFGFCFIPTGKRRD